MFASQRQQCAWKNHLNISNDWTDWIRTSIANLYVRWRQNKLKIAYL